MKNRDFEAMASRMAYLAAATTVLYSLSFIVLARSNAHLGAMLSGLFLALGALFVVPVSIGLFIRLRDWDAGYAALALALALIAAAGSMAHGFFDLAEGFHSSGTYTFPSPSDPRGVMTFGVAGLAVLTWSWIIARSGEMRAGLAYVGYADAALMLILFLGRLIILDATNPLIVVAALVGGFIVNPFWYLRLGSALSRRGRG